MPIIEIASLAIPSHVLATWSQINLDDYASVISAGAASNNPSQWRAFNRTAPVMVV